MSALYYAPAESLGPVSVGDTAEVLDRNGVALGNYPVEKVGKRYVKTTCGRQWTIERGEFIGAWIGNKPVSYTFPTIRIARNDAGEALWKSGSLAEFGRDLARCSTQAPAVQAGEREAFEACMRARGEDYLYRRDAPGSERLGQYCSHRVQEAWEIWQTARQHQSGKAESVDSKLAREAAYLTVCLRTELARLDEETHRALRLIENTLAAIRTRESAKDSLQVGVGDERDAWEIREDGKRVRKDRWQDGFRSIVSIVRGPRGSFEIEDIIELVRAVVGDAARYRWLTDDHTDLEMRQRIASIWESIGQRSYSRTSANIDAAMLERSQGESV